jgi:hypothetical protein
VSLKTRVWRLLGKLDRRVTLIEDTADEMRGVMHDVLSVVTELRAEMRTGVSQIRAAVVEQGRTMDNTLESVRDERDRRAGLGREVMAQSARIDRLERRVGITGAHDAQ